MISERWHSISHFWRNFIVGIAIAIVMHLFHGSSWMRSVEDKGMDLMIRSNAGLERMMAKNMGKNELDFTFLEIDEKSYRLWGKPFHTPRNKLLSLIKFASDGQAKAIVVDIDLSQRGIIPEADDKLAEWLENRQGDSLSPILLTRTIETKLPSEKDNVNKFNSSILDSRHMKSVFWAQPMFRQDSYDKIIRRWVLYKPGCLAGKPVVLPSNQLIAFGLLNKRNDIENLEQKLSHFKPKGCQKKTLGHKAKHKKNLLWGGIDFNLQGVAERIIYTMPWNALEGTQTLDLIRIPAHLITESRQNPSYDSIKGKVVIIGSSFVHSHDLHDTPLGKMPGSLIILNAVKSLALFNQIHPPDIKVKWGIELVLIILASFLFARMHYMSAMIVGGLLTIVILLPISFFWFKYGVWIDFAFPLLAIQMHQIIARYEAGQEQENSKVQ